MTYFWQCVYQQVNVVMVTRTYTASPTQLPHSLSHSPYIFVLHWIELNKYCLYMTKSQLAAWQCGWPNASLPRLVSHFTVIFYVCYNMSCLVWMLNLGKMYITNVCEQDARKIFKPNRQRVIRSCSNLYQFYNLHSSLNINRISKSRMR